MNYKLNASDFTFLYEGCKRCYYLKVVHKITQPSIPLPSIFSKIAGLLKNHYDGKRTEELHSELPPGVVKYGERYVKSELIRLDGHDATCYISGRFDNVAEFDDQTYGVIDYKTGNPNDEHINLYSRQLHAYAYALEHPAPRALSLSPVTKLGLLFFPPTSVTQSNIERISYVADIHWAEVNKDEGEFLSFIDAVLTLLELPNPPNASPDCIWCQYMNELSQLD